MRIKSQKRKKSIQLKGNITINHHKTKAQCSKVKDLITLIFLLFYFMSNKQYIYHFQLFLISQTSLIMYYTSSQSSLLDVFLTITEQIIYLRAFSCLDFLSSSSYRDSTLEPESIFDLMLTDLAYSRFFVEEESWELSSVIVSFKSDIYAS